MKISRVIPPILRRPDVQAKADSNQGALSIRIRTDEGLEGVGETDASPEAVKTIIDMPQSFGDLVDWQPLRSGTKNSRRRPWLYTNKVMYL